MIDGVIDGNVYFEQLKNYRHIFLWGYGTKGIQTLSLLRERGILPELFIDNNKDKWGTCVEGLEVCSYEEAQKKCSDYCILITAVWNYANEIKSRLEKEGETNPVISCINPYKMEKLFLKPEQIDWKLAEKNHQMFADESSRTLYTGFLNWKQTGDVYQTAKYTQERSMLEYMDMEMMPKSSHYTYVDVGAYTGDTVVQFMAFCGMKYEKIVAIEPDRTATGIMRKCFDALNLNHNVEILEVGVGKEKAELTFYKSKDAVYESSNFFQSVSNTLNAQRRASAEEAVCEKVPCDTLDTLLQDETGPMIIKLDLQGKEWDGLQGAQKVIRRLTPILIFEMGTYSDNLFCMIPFIEQQNPNYRFYLRQRVVGNNSRTFVYAIPKERD